jgi:hypothetical protein
MTFRLCIMLLTGDNLILIDSELKIVGWIGYTVFIYLKRYKYLTNGQKRGALTFYWHIETGR